MSDFNQDLLTFAREHEVTVEFRYAKGDSEPIETRRVVPEGYVYRGDVTLLLARDPDRNGEYRCFRLDRIKGQVRLCA